MKIYFDCDGVLSNLDKWIDFRDERRYHPVTKTIVGDFTSAYKSTKVLDSRAIDFIKNNDDCFVITTVPSIDNIDRYNDLEIDDKHIPSKLIYDTLVKNRKKWFETQNIPLSKVIFVKDQTEKMSYSSPTSILIDDNDLECRKWRESGQGLSFLYTDIYKYVKNAPKF